MISQIINGDNIIEMRKMEENSIDSIITDPPYGLQFMGKDWDKLWGNKSDIDKKYVKENLSIDGLTERMRSLPDMNSFSKGKEMQDFHYKWGVEALRVAKPGAHLLSFGGTRVHHRMISGLEDAGWEIRDCLMWVYGQGFPKSHNISKAIDKMNDVEREVVGKRIYADIRGGNFNKPGRYDKIELDITIPTTSKAIQWNGWGTALKPSWEPIVLCRKPLDKTIAVNVLQWGTGGINIDGCRVETDDKLQAGNRTATFGTQDTISGGDGSGGWDMNKQGRFPANLIHDGSDEVVELFPYSKSGGLNGIYNNTIMMNDRGNRNGNPIHLKTNVNEGSAARFFYCAKSSTKERNGGLDNFEKKCPDLRTDIGKGLWATKGPAIQSNDHPTVKPVKLLRYLAKLITPPGGIILDPFAGSGSTGLAAKAEGFDIIMMEIDKHYCDIIKGRMG